MDKSKLHFLGALFCINTPKTIATSNKLFRDIWKYNIVKFLIDEMFSAMLKK